LESVGLTDKFKDRTYHAERQRLSDPVEANDCQHTAKGAASWPYVVLGLLLSKPCLC
jgi:hypothetical protein